MHADDRRGVIARIEQDRFLDQVLHRHGRAVSVQSPLGRQRDGIGASALDGQRRGVGNPAHRRKEVHRRHVPGASTRVAALDRVAHRDEVRRQSEVLHEVGELIVGHVLEEPVLLPMVLEHARVVLDPVEPHASAAPDEVVRRGLVLCLVCEVEEVVSLLEARLLRFAGPAAPVREQPRWHTRQGSGREGSRQKLPPRKGGKREPSSLGHEVTIRHRAEYRLPAPHSCRSRPAHTRRAACCSRRARTCCSSSGSSRSPARNRSPRPA